MVAGTKAWAQARGPGGHRLRRAVGAGLVVGVLAGCGGAETGLGTGSSPLPTTSVTPSGPTAIAGGREDPAVPVPAGAAAVTISRAERPVRVTIASIGVDSSLVNLDITAAGVLQVPTSYQEAGWLDRSAVPGQQGPAVIAGHVDSKSGPGVFYRLTELKPGAKIVITKGDGTKVSFTVSGVERYAKTSFPTAAVYGPVPGPVLRLISCGGVFDRSVGHYRDNVVVFAS